MRLTAGRHGPKLIGTLGRLARVRGPWDVGRSAGGGSPTGGPRLRTTGRSAAAVKQEFLPVSFNKLAMIEGSGPWNDVT